MRFLAKTGSDSQVRACPLRPQQQNHSSLPLRKLESDAEDRCHYERSRRNYSSLQLRKIRIGRGRSLPLRTHQAKPFFLAATKIRIRRGRSLPLRNQQAKPFSPASIPKSGLEIKNHCTLDDVSVQNLAAIPKFTPSNQESLQCKRRFQAKTCSDS